MKQLKNIFFISILILSFIYGGLTLSSTQEALSLWFEKLVPSLFVTLVLVRCIYHLHILDHIHIPLLPALFHMDSASFAFVICIMFLGFPNGAFFIDEAYTNKTISLPQAKRLLYTCSFAAPGFVILTCGELLFHSIKIGIALFLAQIISGLCLLMFTRNTPIVQSTSNIASSSFMKCMSNAIIESGKALYMIGGYLLLFMSVSSVLFQFLPEKLAMILRILSEFSSGVMLIQKLPYSSIVLILLTCMLLSFGGFCVHMQVQSMSEHIPFSYPLYFFFRILQSILSALFLLLFLL